MTLATHELHDAVDKFSAVMVRKLLDNAHKGSWRNDRWEALFFRLVEEAQELHQALQSGDRERVEAEAADVANFAMMLAECRWLP